VEAPSPAYILTRAAYLIGLLVVIIYASSFVKKHRRQTAIIAELESITSDSSFYQQFSANDARKSLVRAIGLIAEANLRGIPPDTAISRGMGLKTEFFANESRRQQPPIRERIIRNCLRGNYQNFLKLGYKADSSTLAALNNGELPAIPAGPQSGRKPVIANLIDPAISPGLEKVIPNLIIRPPVADVAKPTDMEIAAAKRLARDLAEGGFIDDTVCDRILKALSEPLGSVPAF
jgi:hypothetical protein